MEKNSNLLIHAVQSSFKLTNTYATKSPIGTLLFKSGLGNVSIKDHPSKAEESHNYGYSW
jgi:hypothetical protein